MIKGIYTAASGMMLGQTRQDTLANNLANVSTCGYKKDRVASSSFPGMLLNRIENRGSNPNSMSSTVNPIGLLSSGAAVGTISTDFGEGNLRPTENPLDLALGNESYFVVSTPEGERFTRDGQFTLNSDGVLTDQQGRAVMDFDDQEITLNQDFSIDSSGNIFENGAAVDTLKIVHFADPLSLKKEGSNLVVSTTEPVIDENPQVKQGYLEESNVNAISEMVDLIKVVRSYESLQKVVQAEDETLQTTIEKVGSAR
ncbi:MAG TPA: flagellar basal-body rod protein FlgF [Syntrophomonadaceae bacterium]|nr:flagellar basal-body rod protein FlgF [Syntrophomonadaceae bacterium]